MADQLAAVQAEAEVGGDLVEVTLVTEAGKATVRVRPVVKWKGSAIRAMREGNFDLWAEKALADGDYPTWQSLDPDPEESGQFFEAWSEASGQAAGKSSASSRSSRTTARR